MIKRQLVLLRVCALLNICFFGSSHTMELPDVAEQKARDIPSLQSLCTKQLTKGHGSAYVERCKSAFNDNVQKLSARINEDDDLIKNFKQECVNAHYAALPCKAELFTEHEPDFLMIKNNKLYGVEVDDLFIWNLANPDELNKPKIINLCERTSATSALASEYSGLIYIGLHDGTIMVLDSESDTLKDPLHHEVRVNVLAENAYGDLCSADISGSIKIWDVASKECKMMYNASEPANITHLLADANLIYTAETGECGGNLLRIHDLRACSCMNTIRCHKRAITCLVKSKKEKQFYSVSYDGVVCVWDMRNMAQSVYEFQSRRGVTHCQENAAGSLFLTSGFSGVDVWDVTVSTPYKINSMTNDPVGHIAEDEERSQLFVPTMSGIKTLQADCTFDEAAEIVNGWK